MTSVARTNIDIDEDLIQRVMRVHGCATKREAVDLALRRALGDPMSLDEALAMRGRGWSGDLDEMRAADRRRAEHLERLRTG